MYIKVADSGSVENISFAINSNEVGAQFYSSIVSIFDLYFQPKGNCNGNHQKPMIFECGRKFLWNLSTFGYKKIL